jgi:hypothetical protein
VKPLENRLVFLGVVLLLAGCGKEGARELREFAKVESAIGLVAGASSFERGVRLEQLEKIEVSSKRVLDLKQSCLLAYRAFSRASHLLESARQRTTQVEAEVKTLRAKKEAGGTLTKEQELHVLEMSKAATETLKSVTKELDEAEVKVASCQAKRQALRHIMSSR